MTEKRSRPCGCTGGTHYHKDKDNERLKTMNGYKSVDELTPDQLQELKGAMECDFIGRDQDVPAEYLDGNGEITDTAVKTFYSGTMFTDDDFCCTAGQSPADTADGIETMVA